MFLVLDLAFELETQIKKKFKRMYRNKEGVTIPTTEN